MSSKKSKKNVYQGIFLFYISKKRDVYKIGWERRRDIAKEREWEKRLREWRWRKDRNREMENRKKDPSSIIW